MTATLRHALLSALPDQARTFVRVTGDDATRFLQGLLTADVGELTPGRATPAALLTVKGKIVSEIWVLAVDEDVPLLAIPGELGEAVVKRLDDHIIMDDVELELLEGHDGLLIWDEASALAPDALPPRDGALHTFAGVHPLPGVLIVGPRAQLDGFAAAGGCGQLASADAFTAARVRLARPAWGHELRADFFPPEVGFVDAVSYDKGCYLGQEPLSRIHNRGQVNRVMVRVTIEGQPAALPLSLRAKGEDKVVGELTSATSEGGGLAVVRRARARAGEVLVADGVEVSVSSGPLGDDPGGPSRGRSATVGLSGPR